MSFLLKLVTALLLLSATSRRAENGIRIKVTGLRNTNGHVLVILFKDKAGFPDNPAGAFRKIRLDINGQEASCLFSTLPAGKYAVSILHDENDDQAMNKNSLGIPREGYGFSNNVTGAFGPPSWQRASFSHQPNTLTELRIRTRY